ncbi:glucose/arabinose dehydrogenase [Bradyrhizobium japonicum]
MRLCGVSGRSAGGGARVGTFTASKSWPVGQGEKPNEADRARSCARALHRANRGSSDAVAIDKTGALLVADDGGNTVWRVTAAHPQVTQR